MKSAPSVSPEPFLIARSILSYITAAHSGRYRYLTNQLGEELAAFLVLGAFPVLDVGPLTVSCHSLAFPANRHDKTCTGAVTHRSTHLSRECHVLPKITRMITVLGLPHTT
jgi:hypothetical protein